MIDGDGTVRIEEPFYTSITKDEEALFDTPENSRLDIRFERVDSM